MGGFAILAYFHVVPGRRPEFFDLVGRNAAASLAHEPGCRRFDVLTDASDAGEEVVLYEVYDDAAAFDAHLASPHFSAFRAATEGIAHASTVRRLTLRDPAGST